MDLQENMVKVHPTPPHGSMRTAEMQKKKKNTDGFPPTSGELWYVVLVAGSFSFCLCQLLVPAWSQLLGSCGASGASGMWC